MIKATLKRTWDFLDHSQPVDSPRVSKERGTYELERIPNPGGYPGHWLVF